MQYRLIFASAFGFSQGNIGGEASVMCCKISNEVGFYERIFWGRGVFSTEMCCKIINKTGPTESLLCSKLFLKLATLLGRSP